MIFASLQDRAEQLEQKMVSPHYMQKNLWNANFAFELPISISCFFQSRSYFLQSSESFKRQERLRKRIEKEELNEKTFEEVKEEIFEWEEAAEIDPKKIEQIFNGEETEEESEPDKDKKFSKKTGTIFLNWVL